MKILCECGKRVLFSNNFRQITPNEDGDDEMRMIPVEVLDVKNTFLKLKIEIYLFLFSDLFN